MKSPPQDEVPDLNNVTVDPPRPKRNRQRGSAVTPGAVDIEIESTEDTRRRAQDTKSIAFEIVRLFKFSLIGVFIFGILSGAAIVAHPASAKTVQDFAEGYLKTAASLLSGVFGPLLAFVLGHYFGRREHR